MRVQGDVQAIGMDVDPFNQQLDKACLLRRFHPGIFFLLA
jgi:hypothetical protein